MNYSVRKVLLMQSGESLSNCNILIVAGPRTTLLPREIEAIDRYLADGGNALFMIDPFIQTGLEAIVEEFGVMLDDTMIIDSASHFWTDVSAPAVTDYNRAEITVDLPLSFFPGARSLSPTTRPVPGVSSDRSSIPPKKATRVPVATGLNSIRRKTSLVPRRSMVVATRKPEYVEPAEAVLRELRGEKPQPDAGAQKVKSSKFTGKSRVAVIGDSDFATNSFFHIMGNGKLFLNSVNYLASQENMIGIEPRTYDLPRVNLTNRQMKGTFFLSLVLIPALMALVALPCGGNSVELARDTPKADRRLGLAGATGRGDRCSRAA
jgi:ABC-type uncharacterized transport system involved in gliding motility auxiliary subunit